MHFTSRNKQRTFSLDKTIYLFINYNSFLFQWQFVLSRFYDQIILMHLHSVNTKHKNGPLWMIKLNENNEGTKMYVSARRTIFINLLFFFFFLLILFHIIVPSNSSYICTTLYYEYIIHVSFVSLLLFFLLFFALLKCLND